MLQCLCSGDDRAQHRLVVRLLARHKSPYQPQVRFIASANFGSRIHRPAKPNGPYGALVQLVAWKNLTSSCHCKLAFWFFPRSASNAERPPRRMATVGPPSSRRP